MADGSGRTLITVLGCRPAAGPARYPLGSAFDRHEVLRLQTVCSLVILPFSPLGNYFYTGRLLVRMLVPVLVSPLHSPFR